MATICFFNIPATGHVNPSLPLVRALVARGDRLVAFNTEPYRASYAGAGAEFHPYALDYDWEPGQDTLAPFTAMTRILGESERVIPQYLELTRSLDPGVIVYDSMCPWGKQIARILRKPAVCSCSIMYAGWENLRDWPRDTELSRGMLTSPLQVARDLARYELKVLELRRKLGVWSPLFIDFFANPGDMTLMYTSRYFTIGGSHFSGSFKFVGPLIHPREDAPAFTPEWLGDAPLVYVSLGTIFNDRADFFRTCVEAFRDSPYKLILAVGQRIALEDLGALPPNVHAERYVRQLEILPRAAVFITHGGMNSVSESAWFGTPMLLAPQVGDQVFIAKQTAKLGAGVEIDSHRITAPQLRAAAENVMGNPAYRAGSKKIGDSFRATGGIPQALREIDAVISGAIKRAS